MILIRSHDEYARYSEGFPIEAKTFAAVNLRLHHVDMRWFAMRKLKNFVLDCNLLGVSSSFSTDFVNVRRFTNLVHLSLRDNRISCIKEKLWNELPLSLEQLILSKNRLLTISSHISRLKNLKYLDLSENTLNDLPSSICFLENLQFLNVADNLLPCLPASFRRLQFSIFYVNNPLMPTRLLPPLLPEILLERTSLFVVPSLESLAYCATRNYGFASIAVFLLRGPFAFRVMESMHADDNFCISLKIANLFGLIFAADETDTDEMFEIQVEHCFQIINPSLINNIGNLKIVLFLAEFFIQSAIHESDGEVIDDQSNCLLLSRISQTELLVSSACANFSSVDGFSKLHRKLLREVDNLNMIKSEPNNLINKLKSSNISYYSGFIIVAGRYNCCSFFKTFMHSTDSGKQKVEVDIVAEHGTKWVKVCARNTRSLALESVGAGSANKSCLNHARIYMMLARKFPVLSRPPTVIIEFINRVPDFLVRKLLKIGVEVRGTQVPMTDFLSVPTLDSDDDDVDNCRTLLLPQPYHAEPECLNTINFDAIEERKSPARRLLINAMKGKRLIMCASTYEAFQEIVATVAGPSEKKRAKEFLKIVEIVDDKSSERVDRMKFGLTITGRTRRIFSSGDYYRAITATSNRHFINAAQHQGETFAVLLLQSRALSEQKQIDPL